MDTTILRSATLVLLESNSELRRLMKSALLGIGFGHVHHCRSIEQVREAALAPVKPDIFVLDLDNESDAICEMIGDIRHSRLGNNPYVIIIGMTLNPEEPVIQSVLNAGTDDVVRKPVSAKILTERISYLAKNRKDFVATAGYVGPQRAKGVRPEMEEAAQIKVPNSLSVKVSGKNLTKSDETEIERVGHSFTLQRIYSIILPIINISKELEEALAEGFNSDHFDQEISRIAGLVGEVKAIELPDTVRDLTYLTDSLERVVVKLAHMPSPSLRQFEIVRLHAQAIAATMRGDHGSSDEVVTAFSDMSKDHNTTLQ